jgi:hypothetical protein
VTLATKPSLTGGHRGLLNRRRCSSVIVEKPSVALQAHTVDGIVGSSMLYQCTSAVCHSRRGQRLRQVRAGG